MIPCEVSNLKKLFGTTVACENVSFQMKEGEILGLIGANGAGKTTTLNSIVGLVVPTSGDVALFQEDAKKMGGKLRKDLGFSAGEPSYYDNLTVHENLKFVADVKGVPYDRIDYLATQLELNLSKKAKELSLGNKKKMSIVTALLSSPKVIVLDEPTEGLDPLIKQNFIKLMEEEKARGASILISSHALTDVQRLCDRVAIISKGKIIAIEQMEELKLKRLKIVTIETSYSQPEVTLSGVSNLKIDGNLITFQYNGEMKKLVKYLNTIDIMNVQITDADLEKMFLHFYE
jgi:ABC-2 type transport system ATP-binding protein